VGAALHCAALHCTAGRAAAAGPLHLIPRALG
jgi:hypothetical protein